MKRHARFGFGLTTALAIGVVLTLGIWLSAGYYFMKRIADIESRTREVHGRYMQAQELLSSVRAQILLGSVYVRDSLLDPHPEATDYRRQLEETYQGISQSLQQYVPILDSSSERARLVRLQQEIDEFRRTMLEVLAAGRTRTEDARLLLRTKVVPKRETVIRVSEEVQSLNRSAFVQQQREVAAIYGLNQRRLWQSLGIAMATSLVVGLLVASYASRLQRDLETQQVKDAQNARELQHLSAKLITAQEEERRSIARELHDEVGQVLTALKVELAVAQRTADSGKPTGDFLQDARAITEGAMVTVRDLSHLLHPSLLDDLGLPAAVEWYLRGFSRRFDVRAEVVHEGIDRLAPEVEASAYRIIQEALTNVGKHSRATMCRVYLQRLASTVLITIEDNGVGFDTSVVNGAGREGLGLVSIRERALQLRGTVQLESDIGKGARITVELPARPRLPVTSTMDVDTSTQDLPHGLSPAQSTNG